MKRAIPWIALLICFLSTCVSAAAQNASHPSPFAHGSPLSNFLTKNLDMLSEPLAFYVEDRVGVPTAAWPAESESTITRNSGRITLSTSKDIFGKDQQSAASTHLFSITLTSDITYHQDRNEVICAVSTPTTVMHADHPTVTLSDVTVMSGETLLGEAYVKCAVTYHFTTKFGFIRSGTVWHQVRADGSVTSSD